jgi:hypothetical protein
MKKLLLSLVAVSFLLGCDRACKTTVEDFITIQNQTGMDMTLAVCRGNHGQTLVRLLPTTSGIVNLGSREETRSRSNGLGSCSTSSEKNTSTLISLAPMSYGLARLCYRQMDNTYVVVTPYQNCPLNYFEQVSTGPCEVTE